MSHLFRKEGKGQTIYSEEIWTFFVCLHPITYLHDMSTLTSPNGTANKICNILGAMYKRRLHCWEGEEVITKADVKESKIAWIQYIL